LSETAGVVSISGGGRQLGASVAFAGDVDGDGLDDFLLGAPSGDLAPGGAAVLVFGRASFPPAIDLSRDLGSLALLLASGRDGGAAGAAVAGVGDLNGDGFPDLAVGAPEAAGAAPESGRPGRVHIVFGGPSLRQALL